MGPVCNDLLEELNTRQPVQHDPTCRSNMHDLLVLYNQLLSTLWRIETPFHGGSVGLFSTYGNLSRILSSSTTATNHARHASRALATVARSIVLDNGKAVSTVEATIPWDRGTRPVVKIIVLSSCQRPAGWVKIPQTWDAVWGGVRVGRGRFGPAATA